MGRGIRIPNKKTFSTSSLEDRKRESILFGRRQQPIPILGRPDLWTLDIEEGLSGRQNLLPPPISNIQPKFQCFVLIGNGLESPEITLFMAYIMNAQGPHCLALPPYQ